MYFTDSKLGNSCFAAAGYPGAAQEQYIYISTLRERERYKCISTVKINTTNNKIRIRKKPRIQNKYTKI